MHIVVTVQSTSTAVEVRAFGPWDWDKCDRERKRLSADFAHREPWASSHGCFRAMVVEVADEVVAP